MPPGPTRLIHRHSGLAMSRSRSISSCSRPRKDVYDEGRLWMGAAGMEEGDSSSAFSFPARICSTNSRVFADGSNAQLLSQDAPPGLIVGKGSTTLPNQRQGTHHLAMRFLSPRVQLQLSQGMAPRRLKIPAQLVIVRQVAAGIHDMLVQSLTLYQRPLLKLGTIFREKALQEITAIQPDHFFQPYSTDRRIFDALAPVFFAGMKNRVQPCHTRSRSGPISTTRARSA